MFRGLLSFSYKRSFCATRRYSSFGKNDTFNTMEMKKNLKSLTIEDCEFGNIIRLTHESVIADCFHKPTQTTIAAKILLNFENKELKELETEYNTLSELPHHENVITILQKLTVKFPESLLKNHIADEYMESKLKDKTTLVYFFKKYSNNLDDYLFDKRLNIIQYHRILQSMASALFHLEKNLILHGNLNLNKFLIDEDNEKIVLCGFSCSKKMKDETFTLEIPNNYSKYGSWVYQADEIRNTKTPGIINYSKQSSFAFGILMYEIIFKDGYPFANEHFAYSFKGFKGDTKFEWYHKMIKSLISIDSESRLSIPDCVKILNLPIDKNNGEKEFPSYHINDYLPSYDPEYKNLVKKANEENDKIAQYKLANIANNFAGFQYYLMTAASNNYLPAQVGLALYYFGGSAASAEKAIQMLLPAVNHLNNPIAQHLIVSYYFNGDEYKTVLNSLFFTKDENTEEKRIKKIYDLTLNSALQKFPKAQNFLGSNYFGNSTLNLTRNIFKGFQWTIQSNYQRELASYFMLERCYSLLVRDDKLEQSVQFCRKGAYFGDFSALHVLAYYYLDGIFIEKNVEKAILLFHSNAERGFGSSQAVLGEIYHEGKYNCEKNIEKAFNYYKLAAEQNVPNAQFSLASFYSAGEVVDKNDDEAFKWIEKSALNNYADAQFELGKIYFHGYLNCKQDYEKGFYYFKLAADQGHISAIFNVASCYDVGKGVKQDKSKAVSYYKLAAVDGDANANFNVGYCYYFGIGVEKDFKQAVEWLRKAADKGQFKAQYYLGTCYLNGNGVEANATEAFRWFLLAGNQGFSQAQFALGHLCEKGIGTHKDITNAIHWYKAAAEQNYLPAKEKLASMVNH